MTKPSPDDGKSFSHELPTLIQGDSPSPQDPQKTTVGKEGISAEPPVPLSRIGDYELLEEIGRGGMGIVFKARHVRLNRLVALKMLTAGVLARPEDIQRFENEAAAAAQLQHANIVALYEVSSSDGQPYFCMEYIHGYSLAKRTQMGGIPGQLAASYLERVAHAVHYAHSKGIIHRDLKPGNILLDEDEQPKITDFGLAKLIQSDSGQTRTGTVVGTPSYMAPEQANASKNLSPACDVYSLGAILYELITGHPPFLGQTALATLHMVANQDPVTPRILNPQVNRDLETICLKCLEKDPSRRYESSEKLAQDLRRFLDGEAISARPINFIGRTIKWARRRPALASLLLLTLTVLLGFSIYQWRVAEGERVLREDMEYQKEQAELQKFQVERANLEIRQRELILRHLYYLGQMRQVAYAWEESDVSRAAKLLDIWANPRDQPDLRDWEWYFLKSLCLGRRTLSGHEGRARAVVYSPDGTHLVSAGGPVGRPGEIKIWQAKTGKLLKTLPQKHTMMISTLSFSPDGKLFATGSDDTTIRIWNATSGAEVAALPKHPGYVTGVRFSPRTQHLVSTDSTGTVHIWDLANPRTPKLVSQKQEHSSGATSIAFSPNGNLFATGGLDEKVLLWDTAGKVIKTLRGHQGEVLSLAFGPEGDQLVSGGGPSVRGGQMIRWNVASGKIIQIHDGLVRRVLAVATNRFGQIGAAANDGRVYLWDNRHSTEPIHFRADPQLIYGLSFSPDGTSLATAGIDGHIRVWNSSGGLETFKLPGHPRTEFLAFSPKANLLATAGKSRNRDGEIILWSPLEGKRILTLRGHSGQVRGIAFSPDGKKIVSCGDDRKVRLIDLGNQEKSLEMNNHTERVFAVAYSPDGKWIASGGEDHRILLWDAHNGSFLKELPGGNGVLTLAFSPDGKFLASGSYERKVRLWNLSKGLDNVIGFALTGHSGSIRSVAFSPDGGLLASASSDLTIRIWDVKRKKQFQILEGSTRPISAVSFHPEGKRLASVGNEGVVRLWDLVTRQEILQLKGPGGYLRTVAFSADGWSLAAAGKETGIHIWKAR